MVLPDPRFGGYAWDMNASRKFEDRMAEIIRQRGIRPATDAEMQAKDDEIKQEWLEERARVLLGRLDNRYREAFPRHGISQRWLTDWRLGNRYGLVILGERGTGKTWEACALARILLMEDALPVLVVTAEELIDALRPGRDGMSDMAQFQNAPLLVIDDLGTEHATEWAHTQLYRLSNYRNAKGLPNIITSNLTKEQFRAHYDDRIVDRLVEDAELLEIPSTYVYRRTKL